LFHKLNGIVARIDGRRGIMRRKPRRLNADASMAAQMLQAKLRMVANGDKVVNTLRAEQCGCLAVRSGRLLKEVPQRRADGATPADRRELPKSKVTPRTLKTAPGEILAHVFIHTRAHIAGQMPGETARRGDLVTATVPLDRLHRMARMPGVVFIEPGEGLAVPEPISLTPGASAPPRSARQVPGHDGAGVLVGIIDVGGFDFAHPDFLDDQGRTRFESIWDQGGDRRPPPRGFGYGAEFTRAQLDAAIQAAKAVGAPAQEIERQSQISPGSHGTHVASIAAGNRGVSPKATLAGVLVSLGPEDIDPRRSFYDSTRIAHAVDYLLQLGAKLKMPVSLNVSLGTNGHAHDGSSGVSRWIDSALSLPGRALCVAAGNAGQETAQHANDLGYVMGRIHTSGQIEAPGLSQDVEWTVMGNGRLDISENELEIWYGCQDQFAVSVKPPGGEWIKPVEPRQFLENHQLLDGSFISVYNEMYNPANGANYIAIYLTPFLGQDAVVGVMAGTWTVRLHGREIRDGRFHGWIERDDPRRRGRVGEREAWSFPSFFSERSNVDDTSISSLACGQQVIAVANLDAAIERVHITSSEGPTRDGRTKPDISAPGTDIVAANGFSGPEDLWIAMSGTSMASPYACGVASLMLAVQPKITAAQIEAIMRRTAIPPPGASYTWKKDSGYGVLSPIACIEEAKKLNDRLDVTQ
jgi:subtilisin family serine protease